MPKIGNRELGIGPCFVIAELGINHNGSVERAVEMVRAAHKAGADAVKVQAFTASEFVDDTQPYTYREPINGTGAFRYITERQIDMFKRCELSLEHFQAIRDECRKLGILWGATATDDKWIETMCVLGADFLKVGSDDLVYTPLLRRLAKTGKPVILSTGMASEQEIIDAVIEANPAVVLHCVSTYPTTLANANLLRLDSIRKKLDRRVAIGYSDHTMGTPASMVAIARGAEVLEKHFTLDRALPGPDHWFSADASELRLICSMARMTHEMLGDGRIGPGDEEVKMRAVARRSIVAACELMPGDVLRLEHMAYRRPGTGLSPALADGMVGRVLIKDVTVGQQITLDMLATEGAMN